MADRFARGVVVVAGISGALAVMVGAFGAHYLDDWLGGRGLDAATIERRLEITDTAVRYHLIHTVALLALLPWMSRCSAGVVRAAVYLMIAGIFLFSGSLYLLVLLDETRFGMVTPIGGLSWVVAWILVAVAGARGS